MCFACHISESTRQLYKSFVRFGKGSKREYVKTLALRLAMPIMIIMLIMLIMVVRDSQGKRWGGHRSFLVNFVQSSDHVTMS